MADRRQEPRTIDEPRECFVRLKTEKGGPWYGGRIFTTLGLLRAEINGEAAEVLTVWHFGNFVTESEYNTLIAVANSPKPF